MNGMTSKIDHVGRVRLCLRMSLHSLYSSRLAKWPGAVTNDIVRFEYPTFQIDPYFSTMSILPVPQNVLSSWPKVPVEIWA